MIERLLLPHWAVAVEEPINKVCGSTFDEAHGARQAHRPSFLISQGREKQMHVRRHNYHRVQIDGHSTLPKATLEDQLPGLCGKMPPFECPECYENGTIVFEQMRQRPPVGVLPIKVHLC